LSESKVLIINQITLFIEDKAKTLLILIVLGNNLNIKIKVSKIIVNINILFTLILNIIIKGIIFWIVDKINRVFNELVFKIEINQEWNGLIPNFMNSLKFIKIKKLLLIMKKKKNLIKKITDAHLWMRKYFIEFSISIFSFDDITGKNLNIFNSKLIHISKLEFTLKEIIIEIIIKK